MSLGDQLRIRRLELRLSFFQLSKISNIRKGVLDDFEKNKRIPDVNQMEKLKKSLKIDLRVIPFEEPSII